MISDLFLQLLVVVVAAEGDLVVRSREVVDQRATND